MRRQLPVASPIAAGSLGRALGPALTRRMRELRAVSAALRQTYGTPRVALTDSGTSALVLALRLALGEGGTVALPAYACVDIAAAALFARARVRLYDIDPETLSPDLASVEAALGRGVQAIVVAHLYGFPADVPAVVELARRYGVTVIEDAAQAAGGTLHDRPLGTLGALSVLSFGRGKGVTGGHGGALLGHDPFFDDRLEHAAGRLGRPGRGWRDLAAATAQWAFGRPALYAIPCAIPGLRLGEMVYHPAHEPRSLSVAAASLVRRALAAAPGALVIRRRNACALEIAAEEGGDLEPVRPIAGGSSGYLRFPVLDSGSRVPRAALGVLRGYPRTLREEPVLRHALLPGEPEMPGARALRDSLFTLPTHGFVRRRDIDALVEWLRVPNRVMMPVPAGAGA